MTINNQRHATVAFRNPNEWLQAVDEGSGYELVEKLNPRDQASEFLIMGLRMKQGISIERYQSLSGSVLDREKVNHLVDQGLIVNKDNTIAATNSGRAVLNYIIRELSD